ncbi:MAG: mechanosensitive ion channel family protein [Gammaproteobacteria bacterium]|nr:mechanosensitive ion channel family protein [Gammaproteobacteria bacterium]
MLETVQSSLINYGLNAEFADITARLVTILFIITLSLLGNFIAKNWILRTLSKIINKTQTSWDDTLLETQVLNRLAHFAPALILYSLIHIPLTTYDLAIQVINNLILIYIIILSTRLIDALLNAVTEIFRVNDVSKQIPIKSFTQILKIIAYFIGAVLIVAIVLNKTPVYLLSGLGALTAVLLLIFKDTILGFVAGVQLMANRMVARGDWIEMPKHGADGDVLDVTLTTVKIQNWDKTITTIPTYQLISESFKNWRGMSDSDGRRIKRALNIDLQSIRFLDDTLLQHLKKIQFITDYLQQKGIDVDQYNKKIGIDSSSKANGRNLTNIGCFRAYVLAYLKGHPMINQEMTLLVRQLAPADNGIPIEIYVFCKDKNWGNYENIQADIFDHLLAVLTEFDLSVFQNPTGHDFSKLTRN